MNRLHLTALRLRERIRPRGLHVYRYADNTSPAAAGWNTYPGQIIGAWLRLPRRRILSLVWKRAR